MLHLSILDLVPQPALVIRAETAQDQIAQTLAGVLPEIGRFLRARGAAMAGAPFTRYLGFNASGDLIIEAGVPVLEPLEGDARVEFRELPGGRCVTALHTGPYDSLPTTHAALDDWFTTQSRRPAGPRWESYLTDPGQEPDPAQWHTLICQPLE